LAIFQIFLAKFCLYCFNVVKSRRKTD